MNDREPEGTGRDMPATLIFTPATLQRLAAAGLDPERLPRHVAVIMDGNGRWAQQRGRPRHEGHAHGGLGVPATAQGGGAVGGGRPRPRRGVLPPGSRAADALLPVERELEAAAARAGLPDGAAGAVPRRGA